MASKRYRAVRKRDRKGLDCVHHHASSIGGSTARRYAQFGERLIARLGSLDLRDLREEDVAHFVTAEFEDRRVRGPPSQGFHDQCLRAPPAR
jgi:hypothetical protein